MFRRQIFLDLKKINECSSPVAIPPAKFLQKKRARSKTIIIFPHTFARKQSFSRRTVKLLLKLYTLP